jgi:hypothetical protein
MSSTDAETMGLSSMNSMFYRFRKCGIAIYEFYWCRDFGVAF